MPANVDRGYVLRRVMRRAVRYGVKLGLERAFVVGFVGWIRPWHGVDRLVDAVARLAPERPELHLLLVGDGPAMDGLREQVRARGIHDRVHFTGAVPADAIPAHIAAMDVAVQPDVTDYASPIKLFEYLALARPVIAPDKPNIGEVVEHDVSALLFKPGDVGELSGAIQRLHAEPGLRERIAQRGAALIDERGYNWEANARRVIEVVTGVDSLEQIA